MLWSMENDNSTEGMSFLGRLRMALRLIFNADFARQVAAGLQLVQAKAAKAAAPPEPPERVHASGLLLLSSLQREGRLLDFLQQDVTGFSDEEVGAAARIIHSGCKKILTQYLQLEPAVPQEEGASLTVPAGFDAQRIRLTGNVAGQPPFRGSLKHHGWVATQINFPTPSSTLDPRILAPAEVELS